MASYLRRLEVVTQGKGASTKDYVKGRYTYVNAVFTFFLLKKINCAKSLSVFTFTFWGME